MTPELKPCPFCGGYSEVEFMEDNDGEWYRVICPDFDCNCAGGWRLDRAEAVERWNTRTAHADTVRLERLAQRAGQAHVQIWYQDRAGVGGWWPRRTDDPAADLRTALDALPDTSGEVMP